MKAVGSQTEETKRFVLGMYYCHKYVDAAERDVTFHATTGDVSFRKPRH